MGELHLDIYVGRIRREYKVDTTVGKPRVNFRETVTQQAEFDYLHKKQSGGHGQYGRVIGYEANLGISEYFRRMLGQAIPSGFIPAIEKGFKEAANSGSLIGHLVENILIVLTDGASHAVNPSELAFKLAAIYAFRQVPLNNMFGHSTALRSMTQGKGEFRVDYIEHLPVAQDVQTQLINTYKASKGAS